MAIYRLTARLVELQLELAEAGRSDPEELAVARDALVGTRRVLLAALREAEPTSAQPPARRPALQVVTGGRAPVSGSASSPARDGYADRRDSNLGSP